MACAPSAPPAAPAPASAPAPGRATTASGQAAAVQPTAALAAPAAASAGALAPLQPPVKVQFGGSTPSPTVLIAIGEGYFQELGLEVETQILTPTAAVIQAAAANSIQVGSSGVGLAMLNAIERGVQTEIVAGHHGAAPAGVDAPSYLCYLTRPDLLAELRADPRRLRGLTVATQGYGTGSTGDIYPMKLVEQAGLTLADVNAINLAIVDMPAALANGVVDVGWSAEPSTTRLVNEGIGVRYKCLADIYPDHQISHLVYSPAFARENPTAARYFMLAYLRGVRAYLDAWFGDKPETKPRLAQHVAAVTGLPIDILVSVPQAWCDPNGQIRAEQIAADEQLLIQLGYAPRPLNWQSSVRTEYADWAVGILGRR